MPYIVKFQDAKSLAEANPDPIRWVWEESLASGMVTLLTSRWKTGKTTLLSILLSKMSSGGELAGSSIASGKAAVFSEEPGSLWAERYGRFQYGSNVHFTCRPFHGRPTVAEWASTIASLARYKYDLVVIDPLAMFLPGAAELHSTSMLKALEPLRRLTDAGAAVLLLHHPRKNGPVDELSPRGSGALSGFADIILELDRLPGGGLTDRRRRFKTASRLRGSTARIIELTPDGRDYQVVPEPADQNGFEAGWPTLKTVLEDAYSKPTRKQMLRDWPEDFPKPSMNTLIRWLERAERDGLLARNGTGRKPDPYTYSLPGQEFSFENMRGLDELEPLDLPQP